MHDNIICEQLLSEITALIRMVIVVKVHILEIQVMLVVIVTKNVN